MSHLLQDPKDISVLKAYWVNHAVDHNADLDDVTSKKRQTCVGVYGIDIHPDASRFATCGADEKIKIWSMAPIISVNVEVSECVDKLLCTCKYDKSVNQNTNYCFNNTIHCVKWSHDGHYLGSGAADGIVTIWSLSTNHNTTNSNTNKHIINTMNTLKPDTHKNIENWIALQQLTKHRDLANSSNAALTSDVQEIAFSPNDMFLVSAGSDHNIIIYHKRNKLYHCIQVINNAHNDIILGLWFDPFGQFLTSQSADGSAKIWSVSSHKHTQYQLYREIREEFKKRSHFIRRNTNDDLTRLDVGQRGSWSPDGTHLLCSFGVTKDNIFISPMYKRIDFENEHSFVGHSKPTTVSKWNPRIYTCKEETFFVAAIGSMDRKLSVWCSNNKRPLIVFSDIAKEAILDIAWSRSGDILMACTHDGNVMAFVFGKYAFNGRKLSVDQHMRYIQDVRRGNLTPNEVKTMRDNICLPKHSTFRKIKDKSVIEEDEKEDVLNTFEEAAEIYVPTDDVFAPKEDTEIDLNVNVATSVIFNAVEGKQKKHINDYYETQNKRNSNEHHSHTLMEIDSLYSNNSNDVCISPHKESDQAINEIVPRRSARKSARKQPLKPKIVKKKKKTQKEKKDKNKRKQKDKNDSSEERKSRKRDRDKDMDYNGNRKKKRKYNDVFLKIERQESINVNARFCNRKESGSLQVESLVIRRRIDEEEEREEVVSVIRAFKHVNGSKRMDWKTEIAGVITQMVCNEKWTICGTIDGELYCFNHCGLMAVAPMQMEEEIVSLYMSPLYNNDDMNANGNHNNGHFYHGLHGNEWIQNDAYLMIITADCNLRAWKLCKDTNEFDPQQIVKTNFSNLIRMSNKQMKRKDISLKNGFITNGGTIMLTLTNEYVFTYKLSLNCWMRISDDKYWLSKQRKLDGNHVNNDSNEIAKEVFTFSDLFNSMNRSFKAVSNLNKVKHSEVCKIHTISHLEQQLSVLRLFENKENEFECIMKQYIMQLIESLSLNALRFGVNKMDEIFKCLLSQDGKKHNNWPGSVLFQRKLLASLIRIVHDKNTDVDQSYFVQLQQITNKYNVALNVASNDFF